MKQSIAAAAALLASSTATGFQFRSSLAPAVGARSSPSGGASTVALDVAAEDRRCDYDGDSESSSYLQDRRRAVINGAAFAMSGLAASVPRPATAKVEGYAPPSKSLPEEYRQGTFAMSESEEMAPIPRESYVKLPSGLIYADIRAGSGEGPAADVGSRCNVQWVLRRGNGYFVDSSERASGGAPFIFTVGDGTAIRGLDEGVRGMKAGGTRRLIIPVSMGYVDGLEDGKPGPLPAGFGPRQQMRRIQQIRKDVPGEYIFLETQMTRVR